MNSAKNESTQFEIRRNLNVKGADVIIEEECLMVNYIFQMKLKIGYYRRSVSLRFQHHSIFFVKTTELLASVMDNTLMEPGGSMPRSQGLSNNPYPEPNKPNSSH